MMLFSRALWTAVALAVLNMSRVGAVDGIAITTHWKQEQPNAIHAPRFGDLIRTDIRDGKVVGSTPIYTGGDAGFACIGPLGDRVAFTRKDGTVAVMNINGGPAIPVLQLKWGIEHNQWDRALPCIQWPYGQDGQWIYYIDVPGELRRVNVQTRQTEKVVTFNRRTNEFGLSLYATKRSGLFTCRPGEAEAPIYDLALGTGDLWRVPQFSEGGSCGVSVSPNGSYIAANNGGHTKCRIVDRNARIKFVFTINQWAGDAGDGSRMWQWFRWSVNSQEWIAVTQGGGGSGQDPMWYANAALYNWVKGEQIHLTRNPKGEFDSAGGFWDANAPIELALGLHFGEAPFTVKFPAVPEGNWTWDFGDSAGGSETEGAANGSVTHTFRKPGSYTVAARQGERVLRGKAEVSERRPPTGTAFMVDQAHLLVQFDEPVQLLPDAKQSLKSGLGIKGTKLAEEGRSMLIELGGRLSGDDRLVLKGVADRAQVPNPLTKTELSVAFRAWAGEPGLLFLWEARGEPNFCYDPQSQGFREVDLLTWKDARYDRNGGVVLNGGAAFALRAGAGIVSECTKGSAVTIRATITPANIYQGGSNDSRRIIGLNRAGGRIENVNFALGQEADKLVLHIRTRAPEARDGAGAVHRVELCTLANQAPNCVALSYQPGKLVCYLNGKPVKQTDRIRGTLSWGATDPKTGLHFGGREDVPFPWRGTLEAAAISSGFIEPGAAERYFTARHKVIKARKTPRRFELRARLLAATAVPKPADILPYHNALVVNEYAVEKVVRGEFRGEKIRVAHWGIVDSEHTDIAGAKVGDSTHFVVEAFAEHTELESEQLFDGLPPNYDAELYVDVTIRPSGPPRLVRITVRPSEVWLPLNDKFQFAATLLDQYGNPINSRIRWSAAGGGRITGPYGAGARFIECRQPGEGTIDEAGLFTSTGKPGAVTITAAGADDPSVMSSAVVGIGHYPAVNPAASVPLRLGMHNRGTAPFIGDIDRVRFYARALSAREVADHAAGKGLDEKDGLVADWTFDGPRNDAYPNLAGEGLAAKVVGEVQQVNDKDGGYVRLNGNGYLDVAPDTRLDVSTACTLEVWVRPVNKHNGCIVSKEIVWSWGFWFGLQWDTVFLDTLRGADHGWLSARSDFSSTTWTHLVAVLDVNGAHRIYSNGKLIGEHAAQPMVVR
ncbi:MAG: PKD domain-containing protein [Planctomycetes bacterium]|nr:PKD domain-containing protein [Planctomycetota bacterium]